MSESNIGLWNHKRFLHVCGYLGWRSWCWCSSSRGPSGSARPGRTVDEVGRQGRGHTRPARTGTPAALGACRTCSHKKIEQKQGRWQRRSKREAVFCFVSPCVFFQDSDTGQRWLLRTVTPAAFRPWRESGCMTATLSTHTLTDTHKPRLLDNTTLHNTCPLHATSRKCVSFAFAFPGSNKHCTDF